MAEWLRLFLFASLTTIALSAKHLAIFDVGSSTFSPRLDVIALHKFKVKLFATDGALMVLFFPYCLLNLILESSKLQITLIAS